MLMYNTLIPGQREFSLSTCISKVRCSLWLRNARTRKKFSPFMWDCVGPMSLGGNSIKAGEKHRMATGPLSFLQRHLSQLCYDGLKTSAGLFSQCPKLAFFFHIPKIKIKIVCTS